MHVWFKRILALVMALVLVAGAFPVSADAVTRPSNTAKGEQIKQQITTIYRQALRRNGTKSLQGYCGRATDYQAFLLGINKTLEFKNGNVQYDRYAKMDVTSGGYKVNTYPATSYTLEQALLAASYNGTKNIYNLIVGFQKTSSAAGKLYGHACYIHAIIDGKVYFTESYRITIGSRSYKEGSAVVATIKEFAEEYASATFEGLVHFTETTYADECKSYPAHLYVQVTQDTMIQTDPHTTEAGISKPLRGADAGDRLEVIGLFQNSKGEYWYRVQEKFSYGYVPAQDVKTLGFCDDDVTIKSVTAPTRLYRGKTHVVRGQIGTKYNQIDSVVVKVYTRSTAKTYLQKTVNVNSKSYNLNNNTVNNAMDFRDLKNGDYIYKIIANVESYYVENGTLHNHKTSVTLWTSEFLVNRSSTTYRKVTFNANGGTTTMNQAPVANKGKLAILPTATRPGYRFEGWYTSSGTKVTLNTTFKKNTTVYARWTAEAPEIDGWHKVDGEWFLYSKGQKVTGWHQEGNATFYLTDKGMLNNGWNQIDGKTYYFGLSGEMQQGWLDLDGFRYYLDETGNPISGWKIVDGKEYLFDANGLMQTGWAEDNGLLYYFDENGNMVTSMTVGSDTNRYFGSDGSLLLPNGQ